MESSVSHECVCVRKEQKSFFINAKIKTRKNQNHKREIPHKNKKRHTKKKAYAITFPASHAPKLPPIPSHIPLNQPTLSTRKKRRKLFSIEPNPTKNAENDTKTKPKKKAHAHCILLSDSPLTPSLSLALLLFPFLSQASVDIFGSFFPMRKGRAQTKTTQKRLKVESWTTLIMFFQLKV